MSKNKREKHLEDKIKELEEQISHTSDALNETRAQKMIECFWCLKRTRVNKLTYIQTVWYQEPYGCTGGDYWLNGEGQFDCPKCGENNRLYERPDIVALKKYFKEVVKKHD